MSNLSLNKKWHFAAYLTEYDLAQLSSHQLDLINKIVGALSPTEEITKSILANATSVSAIIPYKGALRNIIMTKGY